MTINILLGLAIGLLIAFVIYFSLNKNISLLNAENIKLKAVIEGKNIELADYIRSEARLKSDIVNIEKNLSAHKEEMITLKKELNQEFKILANNIFEEKTQKFAQINEEKLQTILNPLKENINRFEKKVEETYNNETREKASLRKELEYIININQQMSNDAQNLTHALKGDKKLQGNWGEMQLEQLLEKSGLQEGIHYSKQGSYKDQNGERKIPDYIVNLPQDKHYIIDSKVSLVNYEQYFNAEDNELKNTFLNGHIRDIKNHIDELSRKNYQSLMTTPDFVFMYFAFESALFTALQKDNSLFDYAFRKNIILVSTTTLLASLRTVSYIWTQESQRNNATEIARIGGTLYDKFEGFVDNMIKVGKSMDTAKDTYEKAMSQLYKKNSNGSYHAGTIIGQAERLKKLGATPSKQLPQNLVERALAEENDDI